MAAKVKKPSRNAAASGAWRPRIDSEPEFNPFASDSAAGTHAVDGAQDMQSAVLPDPTMDTAPLQGMMDRSDADSLTAAISEPAVSAVRRVQRRRPKAAARSKASKSKASRSKPRRKAKTQRASAAKTAGRRAQTARAKAGGRRRSGQVRPKRGARRHRR